MSSATPSMSVGSLSYRKRPDRTLDGGDRHRRRREAERLAPARYPLVRFDLHERERPASRVAGRYLPCQAWGRHVRRAGQGGMGSTLVIFMDAPLLLDRPLGLPAPVHRLRLWPRPLRAVVAALATAGAGYRIRSRSRLRTPGDRSSAGVPASPRGGSRAR